MDGGVLAVAASRDGQWIASGGTRGTITIWNATTHEKVFELEGHSHSVSSLAFSPDSARVARGSWDNTVIVWSTTTGEQLAGPLKGATDGVYQCKATHRCRGGYIKLFDSLTGSLLAEWNAHAAGAVRSIAISPNGKIIATGSWDSAVRLWDTTTRKQIGPTLQHDDGVNSVAISPEGGHLASGGRDNKVRIWSLTGIIPLSLLDNTASNHAPADVNETNVDSQRILNLNRFYQDGQDTPSHRRIHWAENDFSQGVASVIQQRPNVSSLRRNILNPGEGHSSLPQPLQVPDPTTSHRLTPPLQGVGFAESPTVEMDFWSLLHDDALPPDVRQRKLDRVSNKLAAVASSTGLRFPREYIPKGIPHSPSVIVFKYGAGRVNIDMSSPYDNTATPRNTYRLARQLPAPPLVLHGHTDLIRSLAFLPAGKVISGSPDGSIRAWRVEDGREAGTVEKEGSQVYAVAASSDGQWIASGGRKKTISIWNATNHEKVVEWKGHLRSVSSLAFSRDSARVVSGSWDKTAIVWSTTTGEQLAGLKGHKDWLSSVTFSPNDDNIASCDGWNIRIWDSRSGGLVNVIQGNAWSLAWSPNSQQIIAGCWDNSIKFFNSSTGSLLAEWGGHTDLIRCIAVSPNGKIIASASLDKTVRLWNMTTRQQIELVLLHNGGVTSVAFSPDGSHLASGGRDEKVHIWSLRDIVPLSLLENTASNHAPTHGIYQQVHDTQSHQRMNLTENDGSEGVATSTQQRPNVSSLRRNIPNPAEGHSSPTHIVPDPTTSPRPTAPLQSERVEFAESPTVEMDVSSLLHDDALPPDVKQRKLDRVLNKLASVASSTGLRFPREYVSPLSSREGWTIPASSSSNTVEAQSIHEQQTADPVSQPSELLGSNTRLFPERVIQGEQPLGQSTKPADVPTSRFTSAPEGDLRKNQKIAEIKPILMEMLREIRFPMRKNRLPWFTLEDDLLKHGYTIVNWPSGVPRENDKGIRSLNASQVDMLYCAIKQARDTDRLRFERCEDGPMDHDDSMTVAGEEDKV
ncbi:WD40-repeat-containing domain protein [Melanogaster broomeanus]|nr:WD40-repeat-containing domain protein [Melanogaster broomeanus]